MKIVSYLIIITLVIGALSCRKLDVEELEGNWSLSVTEFEFNDKAQREAFHTHDTAMNHYVFGDTNMTFVLRYFLPKVISFKIKKGQMILKEDIYSKEVTSPVTKIKTGKNMVLCDSIFFYDGYYYGAGPLCASGFARLEGKFKNESTFEGTIKIVNIFQRVNDKNSYFGVPIYSYHINKTIPVRLIKQ